MGPSSAELRLASPAQGSLYRLDPAYSADAQRLLIEATGEAGLQAVTLWVDGVQVASLTQGPYRAWWQLSVGAHTAWAEATLSGGAHVASERISFTVK
jgi:hypothetical protein